jgi:hypothetical protein
MGFILGGVASVLLAVLASLLAMKSELGCLGLQNESFSVLPEVCQRTNENVTERNGVVILTNYQERLGSSFLR